MEAKDTVMNEAEMAKTLPEIFDGSLSIDCYDTEKTKFLIIAKPQAEHSFPLGEKQGYEKGMKEAGLQLGAKVDGIDEFMDWSEEGLRIFRKSILSTVKTLLKEWGISEEAK